MGIQGLIPFLQKCSRKVDMSEFSGCTVAIDAYCWLHKGAFSCAEKLARGEHTDQYVQYCMKFVNMLLSHNIRPILVFDGCHLPAKADTEKSRRERREATRKKAGELLRSEKVEEARQMLRRCVDISHDMAHKLITRARAAGVDSIVAPYEADAQLAYLNISGMAHFVITEDSDLLLFGCSKVVFKLDVGGAGLLVEQEMLPVAMNMRPEEFSLDKFRQMCVLSGCDYLPSLPGIGLTKACKFVKRTSQSDISKIVHKMGSYLNMPNLKVPEDYKDKFNNAMNMFKHQPAFNPVKRVVVPLTPIYDSVSVTLPEPHPPETALQLALGNVDPISMRVVDDWNPDIQLKEASKHKSIWSKNYRIPAPLDSGTRKLPEGESRKVTSTLGKRMYVPSDHILPLPPDEKTPSVEEELEELRESWALSKKRRLEDVSPLKEVSCPEELVEPSPPRPNNPFSRAGGPSNNKVLSPSTLLSRLTTPSPTASSRLPKSSFTRLSSSQSLAVPAKAKTVISRYFTSTSVDSSEVTSGSGSVSKIKAGQDSEKTNTTMAEKGMVVPESPVKPSSPTAGESPDANPTKKNVFSISRRSSCSNTSLDSDRGSPVSVDISSSRPRILMPSYPRPVLSSSDLNPKSILSAMETEDDNSYRKLGPIIKSKPETSNFKWKPLNTVSSEPQFDLQSLETPPSSQENYEVISAPPVAPDPSSSQLKEARTVGLLRKKSNASVQTVLSKFKFQSKPKMKMTN